jgi:transposase
MPSKDGKSRKQIFLPNCIDDYVEEYSPVRVIDLFVDTLELKALGFKKAVPAHTGRPSYTPGDLLKLYVYGYMNKMRSSRRLMVECRRNMEVMFLLNELTPDFRTISDFRKDNPEPIREVFREFVRFCNERGLYRKELIAIDGTKIRAQNSGDKCYNRDILIKKIERIDAHIEEYMSAMERNDEAGEDGEEEDGRRRSPEEIEVTLKELHERKNKYKGYMTELAETGATQILETDSECHRMHTRNGFHCCYNVQTATDAGSHLICEYEVTGENSDAGHFTDMAVSTRKILSAETLEAVADKGYDSRKDVLDAVQNGVVPHVALKYDKTERIFNFDYKPADITSETKDSVKPEDIRTCLSAGVLPSCFENKNMSIAVQELSGVACFTRVDEKHVLCPMGKTLARIKRRNNSQTIFRSREACRICDNRCAASKNPKEVSFVDGTKYVPVQMYGDKRKIKNVLPSDAAIHHNSRALHRKWVSRKVVLHVGCDEDKIHERMCTVEHPFGSVKWYGDAGYFLCRGKRKVSAEIGLSFLGYNMKRAINMVGTEELIRMLGE